LVTSLPATNLPVYRSTNLPQDYSTPDTVDK
jgi:hypothetical protein